METFTLDPRRWRIARVFGRNPLLRRTDRIEAAVVLLAFAASLIAVPVAGVVGATVYAGRAHLYAQEAHERHHVTGTVTGARRADPATSVAQVRWPAPVGDRTGTLRLDQPVSPGENIELWVDNDGNPSPAPTPAWHAVADGAAAAGAVSLIVGAGLASAVAGARSRLDRARDALWEREIRCLADDGGRTNRP
ncbi:hypothetical protein BST11_15490 [Mycobacterium alsense]|uniref:Uncharacterized protein n=1 Tax=Mycobacterium alsense TaxID=324058 RepID=A0AA41XNZ2_9MYCO|nr:hypothetical protein [Mycobacterium alsense]MCV7379188.1 hypothetical protein [Mycobacterium alsense]OQZ89858.1 hypothetical protein BST11_15490 [Mycobacterium alsense]